jgi:hypothetical protein
MTDKRFNPDYPVVLAICGEAGTGKTTLADKLAPPASTGTPIDGVVWDHIFFAAPLYEMVTIRTKIEGEDRRERILYELHQVLLDVFGNSPLYGAPPYDKLVEMVKHIAEMPVETQGKPRSFMQAAGAFCRAYDSDCFVKRTNRIIKLLGLNAPTDTNEDPIPLVVVVSDLRQGNEAEMIAEHPNGIVVRLLATEEERRTRLRLRDGKEITQEQLNIDDAQLATVPTDVCDHLVDTNELTEDEVADTVRRIVLDFVKE